MTFNSEGRLDVSEREKSARAAMDMLDPIFSDKKPGRIIDAKHKFAKKRFDDRYLWDPSPEIKAAIEPIIFQK